MESIIGLLKSLKIRALVQLSVKEKEAVSVPFQETRFTSGFQSPSRPKLPGNCQYRNCLLDTKFKNFKLHSINEKKILLKLQETLFSCNHNAKVFFSIIAFYCEI